MNSDNLDMLFPAQPDKSGLENLSPLRSPELQALKDAAMDAWRVYQAAVDTWEYSAPGQRTDACIAMMACGVAYSAAWDAYEKAVKNEIPR